MAAFTTLVRSHEAAVRRFLNRLTPAADDLAQEVFLKAWRFRRQQRDGGNYKAWLMRIAWTEYLTSSRAEGRRLARDTAAYESSVPIVVDRSGELRQDIAAALKALDVRQRAVAQLCFAEGYSHGEAAGILDLPLGTLKSIAARVKAQLATVLRETA